MVDLEGFEPLTSAMRTQRSPSWATGPYDLNEKKGPLRANHEKDMYPQNDHPTFDIYA